MLLNLETAAIGRILQLVLVALVARFIYKLIQVRLFVRSFIRKTGLSSPPHSIIFGHLPAVARIMMKHPPDTGGQSVPFLLLQEYPELGEKGLICMDSWPFANPMLAVFQPEMMAQFCQEKSTDKSPLLKTSFHQFMGSLDLVCSNGAHWKKWRAIFNPGFNNANILSMVPAIMEEIDVFKDCLLTLGEGDKKFELVDLATKASADVIGRVALGIRIQSQTKDSLLLRTMKHQLKWIQVPQGPDLLHPRYSPFRPLIVWNNNRILRNLIMPTIHAQLQETGKGEGHRTIGSLATDSYLKKIRHADHDPTPEMKNSLLQDEEFLRVAVSQLEVFLIAGHDTTASSSCYVYYCLNRNPHIAERVRQEHEAVLGPKEETAAVIANDPSILYRLPYTTAVIKETLRLFPPLSSFRWGSKDVQLVNPDTGLQYPTEGFNLLSSSITAHRHPDYWVQPETFIPERFLVKEGDPLYPRKNAYRPFELGPRNCIGQELAMIELRLMLVTTMRELDVIPIYAEDARTLFGEPGYQANVPGEIIDHPKDGMPVRVRRRT